MEIKEKGLELGLHFCSCLIDGVFLCLWAATNFGIALLLKQFHLEGLDAIIAIILQYLFGLSTLAPIVIFIYRDIRIMWIRAAAKVSLAQGKKLLDGHD